MFLKKYLILLLKFSIIFIPLNINFFNFFAYASYDLEKENFNENNTLKSTYLVDSGDGFFIEFIGLEIFSKNYFITRNGTLILPEIGEIYVKDLSKKELQELLIKKYEEVIINPEINIYHVSFRPVRIYITGEINNPGFYTFNAESQANNAIANQNYLEEFKPGINTPVSVATDISIPPTVYDAIQKVRGITSYADLSNIKIVRRNSRTSGGGKIQASINILNMILYGDQSENINLQDGDTIIVPKSKKLIKDQIFAINQSNITPLEMRVYLSGNVKRPGRTIVQKGTSLIEAIIVGGGQKNFTGNVELISFNGRGEYKKKVIKYDRSSTKGSINNPILNDGDIIYVRQSLLGKSTTFLTEVGSPIVTGVGLYKIFDLD
tara:strand:+ start:1396 stop:2532 length:1137 start_codon:yes stop_codon:yes gene_type:complete